eukprot:CAMPEP_0177631504 /NCGR_PEP_ID=MMETSP0447-20121125/1786_1 /TAXON_ID=0 /ORGANISM="Stygamoeba regulata, Strain BSH-02190019" /LENGTH=76 /DNA_ID=CAMNT_0019132995 /DNA_START=43 /DNA_END=273 /DNA_ORIENTATION=+
MEDLFRIEQEQADRRLAEQMAVEDTRATSQRGMLGLEDLHMGSFPPPHGGADFDDQVLHKNFFNDYPDDFDDENFD